MLAKPFTWPPSPAAQAKATRPPIPQSPPQAPPPTLVDRLRRYQHNLKARGRAAQAQTVSYCIEMVQQEQALQRAILESGRNNQIQ